LSAAPRWQRAFVIATCAVIGGAFAYAACGWGQWPCVAYIPLERTFTLHPPQGAIAMLYPGIVLWGVGGAAVGAAIGAGLCAAWRRPWPDRALQLLGAWAIAAIVIAGVYYTWTAWPW
jgi:hypothetical protein